MVNFGYPYNDLVICKDSTDYLATKCNILRATHARKKIIITKNYKLNGQVQPIWELNYRLSADMKWNTHLKKTVAKGNQMLGVLRRNLKNCHET